MRFFMFSFEVFLNIIVPTHDKIENANSTRVLSGHSQSLQIFLPPKLTLR